jgi:hypothetical protein
MIPTRLPWRPRARPSATLHEILACSIKSKLGIKYYNRPSGLSSGNRTKKAATFAEFGWRLSKELRGKTKIEIRNAQTCGAQPLQYLTNRSQGAPKCRIQECPGQGDGQSTPEQKVTESQPAKEENYGFALQASRKFGYFLYSSFLTGDLPTHIAMRRPMTMRASAHACNCLQVAQSVR